MQLTTQMISYIEEHEQEARELLLELAQIPAPSNHEEKRAEFCCSWLKAQGASGVYVDEALNVIYPVGCRDDNDLMVFMAHSDVVFPDTKPLALKVENGKIYCPGIGDDTANVVALLMAAKFIAEKKISPQNCGLLLVINSGEEGLGNLKGCRKIMERFGSRVREFVAFDDHDCRGVDRAVGSMRYRVSVRTEGGHSYGNFGRPNAIAVLGELISDLYAVQVPKRGKTTYNVGTISGGTSVNTIAQNAEMLYEFRSDDRTDMKEMEDIFRAILIKHENQNVKISVTLVGARPCSAMEDTRVQLRMKARASAASLRCFGEEIRFGSGSTDCNIPLSMGVPAICVGCYRGGGAHTRGEYVEADSLLPGLKLAFELVLHHF